MTATTREKGGTGNTRNSAIKRGEVEKMPAGHSRNQEETSAAARVKVISWKGIGSNTLFCCWAGDTGWGRQLSTTTTEEKISHHPVGSQRKRDGASLAAAQLQMAQNTEEIL